MFRQPRRALTALTAALTAFTGAMLSTAHADAGAAGVARIVVAPGGNDRDAGTADHPVATLAKARQLARSLSGRSDVVVELTGGIYRLTEPLRLTGADSGRNGHTVTWRGRPGQTPVLSGALPVTGWKVHDAAANIYAAAVPKGTDSRQLYVDGASAPRASITISRNDVKVTKSGLTIVNPALNYLATLPRQNRIGVESQNSFTDRYSPVQRIDGTTITMQQPAWNNNNWAHDGGSLYNLSASPGTVIEGNYIYDNRNTVGLYLDEGSRYVTLSRNVIRDSGVWAFTNASSTNNTNDSTFAGNWYNTGATQVATGSPHNNILSGNVQVSGGNWPTGARQVMDQAGIEPGPWSSIGR